MPPPGGSRYLRAHMRSTRSRSFPHAFAARRALAATTLLAATIMLAGCSKPAPPGDLKIGEITTGRAAAPDGSIVEDAHTMMFWNNDTIYVSVVTEGSAENVTLAARWTGPDGKVTAESKKTLSPKGTTITSFEAPPPKDKENGWPDGDYKVEILVNGVVQGSRDVNARH